MHRLKAIAPWLLFTGTVLFLLLANQPGFAEISLSLQLTFRLLFVLAIVSMFVSTVIILILSSIITVIQQSQNAWSQFFRGCCWGWLISFALSIPGFPGTLFILDLLFYQNTTKDASRITLYLFMMLVWLILISAGTALGGLRFIHVTADD